MKNKTNSGENVFVFRSVIRPEKLKDIAHATLGFKQTDTSSSGDGLIKVGKSCNIIIMVVTLILQLKHIHAFHDNFSDF